MNVLPVHEARRLSRTGEATLLDIREEYEAATARVHGATRIPLGLLLAEPDRAPRGRPILVVDHEGTHTTLAVRYLRENGRDAHAVEGGALAWLQESRA